MHYLINFHNDNDEMDVSPILQMTVADLEWLMFKWTCLVSKCVQPFTTPWTAACKASLPHHLLEFAEVPVHSISAAISSSFFLFLFCVQSFPASGSFPMSQLFASGGRSIGTSASASVFTKSIQGWSPFRWTGLLSLLSKGVSRAFSSTTVGKHQLFSTLPSLLSSSLYMTTS